MADSESQKSVLIRIKDHDPLNVSASRLTADSSVFRWHIDDLGLSELEIEEFEPETVILFLKLLEDKSLGDIEESMFRELHKLAVVYDVGWLFQDCRNWLYNKIMRINWEYTRLLFLFEECIFIVRKWGVKRPINLFVSKLAMADKINSRFILRYVENLSDLNTVQIDYLLKLAGTNNRIFIDIMYTDLQNKVSLTDNLRYLLKNIHFDQISCSMHDRPYGGIFRIIARLQEITKDDLRLALEIQAGFPRWEARNPDQETVIMSQPEFNSTRFPRNLLEINPV